MKISDLSQSVTNPAALASIAERAVIRRADNDPQYQDDDKGHALDAFRSELRTTLRAKFYSQFSTGVPGYATSGEAADARAVANEAIGAARRVAAEAPVQAASSLILFRATVRDTATVVRENLGARDDSGDIDDAVALVDRGLDNLDTEYAGVRESTASVVSVDASVKERSVIRIRTQEGDFVVLDLRQKSALSASDTVADEGRLTEVALQDSASIRIKVDGDLNDDELAAIQNVVAQATSIADDFFGGDLGDAFNSASGFAFDAGQLARVDLRFRYTAETNVRLAAQTTTPAEDAAVPAAPAPPAAPAVAAPTPLRPSVVIPALPVVQPVAEPDVVAAATDADTTPAVAGDDAAAPAAPVDDVAASGDEAGPPLGSEYLDEFFDVLSDFLRSVSEGFGVSEAGVGRLQYSTSFKLTILREALSVAAPPEQQNAAEVAVSAVDRVLDVVGEAEDAPGA